jgi:hypothetical protein
LLIQDRWQAAKTARIYINSGSAAIGDMKIPMARLRGFQGIYAKALNRELRILAKRAVQAGVERA